MLHVMIGRGRQSDFRVENGSVSRVHAVLKAQGEKLRLEDRGSKNGTYIRSGQIWKRIETADILKTDRVRFGEQEVNVADIVNSVRKRPKIGGGAKTARQAAKRPKIGAKAGTGQGEGGQAGGNGETPLKKFVKPRRNQVTGDIEEGG